MKVSPSESVHRHSPCALIFPGSPSWHPPSSANANWRAKLATVRSFRRATRRYDAATERAVVKIIARSDGHRRVLIERGEDGRFRFIEQARHEVPLGVSCKGDRERWASLRLYATICDTAASAQREARATIDWLNSSGFSYRDTEALIFSNRASISSGPDSDGCIALTMVQADA